MKHKLISTAVAAALAGGMGAAHAVYNNPDGLGQVLLFPFYTVEGTQDTYINVVNTTSAGKAVKVRFLEGMNSQEVLDFNLYLSPYDHWSGVITRGTGEAAILRTADTSCTVPAIPAAGVAFRNAQYQGDSEDGLDRTREGYVELIEMGELNDENSSSSTAFNPLTWATHVNGTPDDCQALVDAWQPGAAWRVNNQREITAPQGGLYGYGVLIDPPNGTAVAYDATALDAFWAATATQTHSFPGSVLPSLEQAAPVAQVFDAGAVVNVVTSDGIDAVSAVLMHDALMNDYVLAAEINAETDWVVNFPTKRFYVNNGFDQDGDPLPATPPFSDPWDPDVSEACEPIRLPYWDREEEPNEIDDVDFSPAPPSQQIELCKEVNILQFGDSNVLEGSARLASSLNVTFENGWAQINFTGVSTALDQTRQITTSGAVFNGLPSIGFAIQQYENGVSQISGNLSNYTGLVNHKATRSITLD